MPEDLLIKVLERDVAVPGPARNGDAGIDLTNAGQEVLIPPMGVVQFPVGLCVKVPEGHFGMIVGRSSTFVKKGLIVPTNIIDSGYVGPLYVTAFHPCANGFSGPRIVQKGERIAQLIVIPYAMVNPVVVERLPETERGENGFGSTG